MKPVILLGTGLMAMLVHYYLTHDSPYHVSGFASESTRRVAGEHLGLPLVPLDEVVARFPVGEYSMFVATGPDTSNKDRAASYRQARSLGYDLISYVSSSAAVWPESAIGDNCFIMERNVIQPFTTIGNDVVMWSGCHVGQGAKVGDHALVGAHAVLSDLVTVGQGCVVGENATIGNNVTLGRDSVIGAGTLILTDTGPGQVREGGAAKLLPLPSDRLLSI